MTEAPASGEDKRYLGNATCLLPHGPFAKGLVSFLQQKQVCRRMSGSRRAPWVWRSWKPNPGPLSQLWHYPELLGLWRSGAPAVNYGHLCQLESLQKFNYKGAIDHMSALGSDKALFLSKDRVGEGY